MWTEKWKLQNNKRGIIYVNVLKIQSMTSFTKTQMRSKSIKTWAGGVHFLQKNDHLYSGERRLILGRK